MGFQLKNGASVLVLSVMLAPGARAIDYMPPAKELWKESSPDGRLMAAERIMPDPIYLWNPDMDGARLLVLTVGDKGSAYDKGIPYVAYDLPRLIAQIAWSPDSRFIVMTTVSAGGHSPWHYDAYVFTVSDGSLRYIDNVVGLVVGPDVKFAGLHSVVLKISGRDNTGAVDFDAAKPVTIDLSTAIGHMGKQGGKIVGKTGD